MEKKQLQKERARLRKLAPEAGVAGGPTAAAAALSLGYRQQLKLCPAAQLPCAVLLLSFAVEVSSVEGRDGVGWRVGRWKVHAQSPAQ